MSEGDVLPAEAVNGEGSKDVDPQTLLRSVIDSPSVGEIGTTPPSIETSLLMMVANAADEFTPWGVRPKERDKQLRDFFPTESMFSSALGIVCARNAAFSWALEGPDLTLQQVATMLEGVNQGRGWEDFVTRVSIDLYTQDAGAFVEIVRGGDAPASPIISFNHLDAYRCHPTGVPEAPVLYQDRRNKWHLLKWWNVHQITEMPTPIEGLYGLQYCALTNLLLAAQIIKNISIYKYEKTGGRHNRAIHFVSGIASKQINAVIEQYAQYANAQGLQRYVNPIVVGSVDPKNTISTATLELASLPDHFNEETNFKHYVSQVAMAFKSDYQEFAPLPGGNLGTSTQSEVLHMKSRGKGPAIFMNLISHMMNVAILPANVLFKFEEQDLEAEEARAEIARKRAETLKIQIESGMLDPDEGRQIAAAHGDIPPEIAQHSIAPTAGVNLLPEKAADPILAELREAADFFNSKQGESPFDAERKKESPV